MYNILVAEDELLERKVLCKFLKRSMGDRCTVLEAGNGREAVELFEKHHPAVAILDIRMPGLTGLEAARIIRQSGKPCVILFLTAFDKFEYAREAISLRAMDYLLKPYSEQELLLSFLKGSQLYSHWYPIFAVMIGTGLRIGEVAGLRWCDIDLDEGIIDVNHTLVYYDHRDPNSKKGCYFNVH